MLPSHGMRSKHEVQHDWCLAMSLQLSRPSFEDSLAPAISVKRALVAFMPRVRRPVALVVCFLSAFCLIFFLHICQWPYVPPRRSILCEFTNNGPSLCSVRSQTLACFHAPRLPVAALIHLLCAFCLQACAHFFET